MAVIVEEGIGVDEGRREELADRVLEAVSEQVLANVKLGDAQMIELAECRRRRNDRPRQYPALLRRQFGADGLAILDHDGKRQRLRRSRIDQIARDVEVQLAADRVAIAKRRGVRKILPHHAQPAAKRNPCVLADLFLPRLPTAQPRVEAQKTAFRRRTFLEIAMTTQGAVEKERIRAVVEIARCLEILILGEGGAAGQRNPHCEKKPFHDVDHPLGQLVQTGCAAPRTLRSGSCYCPGVRDNCTIGARR